MAAAWSWRGKYLEDFPEIHRKPNPLGARRNEIFRLKWEDVDFFQPYCGPLHPEKPVTVHGNTRDFPTDNLYETLRKFHRGRAGEFVFVDPETDRPFTSRQHWLKKEGK